MTLCKNEYHYCTCTGNREKKTPSRTTCICAHTAAIFSILLMKMKHSQDTGARCHMSWPLDASQSTILNAQWGENLCYLAEKSITCTTLKVIIAHQIHITSSFPHFTQSATFPRSPWWVTRRWTALCAELSAASRLRLLRLLLPDCNDPLQLQLPICVHFNCCSPFASASAAAPWLRPLHLLPQLRLLRLLVLSCVPFN